jgi:hypothetical protein
MRTIGQRRGLESQLHIIQESSQELILQIGDKPKLVILKKARRSMLLGLISLVISTGFIFVFMGSFINANRGNIQIPITNFYPFYFFFSIFMIAPFSIFIYAFYAPLYISWTLDRSSQTIIKNGTNLLDKTRTYEFNFNEIQSINVEEHHDRPHALTELYMVLKSGKQLTLSVSSYTFKEHEKANNLKYHQSLAEKIRYYVGLQTYTH